MSLVMVELLVRYVEEFNTIWNIRANPIRGNPMLEGPTKYIAKIKSIYVSDAVVRGLTLYLRFQRIAMLQMR